MVQGIDLKPLTEETITQMGYNNHDLWLVKLGSVVFGPYETESLKHYVLENEHLFEEAEASRTDETEWKPFWAHTKFQRRKPQAIAAENHQGPFWIMDFGLKSGPYSFREIDKKIEMGLLVMTDHLSVDEGYTWVKIYEIEGFDRRSHSPDDLPIAPYESSFQKAKLALVEKMEDPHLNTINEVAELVWQGHQNAKVIPFKIEEMTLRSENEVEISVSLKWAIPTAAALLVTIVTSGYFVFSPETEEVVALEEPEEKQFYQKKVAAKPKPRQVPKAVIPSARPVIIETPIERMPASTGYSRPVVERYPDTGSRYPTHVETHQDDYPNDQPYPERDPLMDPMNGDPREPEIHSLVNEPQPAQDQSLDAAMNGVDPRYEDPYAQPIDQMDRPVVDEASDF